MKPVDHRLFVRALREWIYSDESGRNTERVAEFVIAKAMTGHFAYFKLVIDLVDGKVRPTAEDELTFEADWFCRGRREARRQTSDRECQSRLRRSMSGKRSDN